MTLSLLLLSFVLSVLVAVFAYGLHSEAEDRAANLGRAQCRHSEELSDVRARLGVAETRLKGHDSYLEYLERVACKAHGQSVLTDDRLNEFAEWAGVARTDVLARVEEAAAGLVTAANVLRLIPAPDVTSPAPAPLDERHHDDPARRAAPRRRRAEPMSESKARPDKAREAVTEYARQLMPLMGLKDWALRPSPNVPDGGTLAFVEPIYGQKFAFLGISDSFFGLDPDRQRQTVTHELTHLHFAEACFLAFDSLSDDAKPGFRLTIEYGVDAMAEALASHLPLPASFPACPKVIRMKFWQAALVVVATLAAVALAAVGILDAILSSLADQLL